MLEGSAARGGAAGEREVLRKGSQLFFLLLFFFPSFIIRLFFYSAPPSAEMKKVPRLQHGAEPAKKKKSSSFCSPGHRFCLSAEVFFIYRCRRQSFKEGMWSSPYQRQNLPCWKGLSVSGWGWGGIWLVFGTSRSVVWDFLAQITQCTGLLAG